MAEERDLVLMPGHTFLYSPSVNKVRDLIQEDELGEIYFVTSSRMNLGLYQQDGVVLDLAPHDLSILLHWLGKPLVEVSANGRSVFQEGVHETAFLTLRFEGGTQANVQLSWLAPRKMRQMVVVGSQPHGPVRGHRRRRLGPDLRPRPRLLRAARQLRRVPPHLPHRRHDRPADRGRWSRSARSCSDFASAIREGTTPVSNARLGLEIVLGLEALEQSLHAQRRTGRRCARSTRRCSAPARAPEPEARERLPCNPAGAAHCTVALHTPVELRCERSRSELLGRSARCGRRESVQLGQVDQDEWAASCSTVGALRAPRARAAVSGLCVDGQVEAVLPARPGSASEELWARSTGDRPDSSLLGVSGRAPLCTPAAISEPR